MTLTNSVIAITGAGRGLGRTMALALAKQGARLALIDLEAPTATAQLIHDRGGKAQAFAANVADEAQMVEVFTAIEQNFGRLDGMINNAGITRDGLLLKVRDGEIVKEMSLSQWQQVIDVNLTGTFLGMREAAKVMIRTGTAGCIINISSISAEGNLGQTNYSASKAGVRAMAVTGSKELAAQGIRVAAVAPGFIGTEMVRAMPENALAKIEGMIPAGRIGEPDEIAKTIQFILENDYVNGVTLSVNGGLRL